MIDQQAIAFRFEIEEENIKEKKKKEEEEKKLKEEEEKKKKEEEKKKQEEEKKKRKLVSDDEEKNKKMKFDENANFNDILKTLKVEEEFICPICHEIMYNTIMVIKYTFN
jgi:hypothetical protein